VSLSPRYREMADEHVRHLALRSGRPQILDVGCGEGEFLRVMESAGWLARGLDLSGEAVAVACGRGVRASQGTLAQASLQPSSFDAITFRLVFEHLRDPVAALAECRRALKPHGLLWIATPSLDAAAHRVFGRNWIHLEPPRHVVLYTASALVGLLTDAGFDVVDRRPLRQARWSYRLSDALAQGLSPFENAPSLTHRLALNAAIADLIALRRPETADVVVLIARAA
jgi:2-polyprenyl-3-methyl-5-hydroxy-6-metoxy-1,4-benzoquinol methylase